MPHGFRRFVGPVKNLMVDTSWLPAYMNPVIELDGLYLMDSGTYILTRLKGIGADIAEVNHVSKTWGQYGTG